MQTLYPLTVTDLQRLIVEASEAHHTYEQTALKGARDEQWAFWYATHIMNHLQQSQGTQTNLRAIRKTVTPPQCCELSEPFPGHKEIKSPLNTPLDDIQFGQSGKDYETDGMEGESYVFEG